MVDRIRFVALPCIVLGLVAGVAGWGYRPTAVAGFLLGLALGVGHALFLRHARRAARRTPRLPFLSNPRSPRFTDRTRR